MLGPLLTPPSLKALLDRLHSPRPPALAALMRRLEGSDSSRNFVEIVRTLLPSQADHILGLPRVKEQITAFDLVFKREYFPLFDDWLEFELEDADSDEDALDRLCNFGMPIPMLGIDSEELHYMAADWDKPQLLMACLGDISSRFYGDNDEGVRVTWLESLGNHVERELLQRIPEGGWPLKRLQVLLHDTEYEGAIFMVEWILGDTGCQFFDLSREDGWENPSWSLINAYQGKLEHLAYEAISGEIDRMQSWLEEDLNGHCAQLLDFIEQRDREIPQEREYRGCRRLLEIFRPAGELEEEEEDD